MEVNDGLVHNSTMKGHEEFVTQMAWSPEGKLLAAGGKDKTVHVWRLGEEKPFQILRKHEACVSCVAWRPDGRLLASGSDDLTIVIWDVESGESVRRLELKELDANAKAIKCVAWPPDGSKLFSGGEDGRLRCWNADDGRQRGMQITGQWWVLCIAWSPRNDRFATGGGDGSICLWETSDAMKPLARFGGNEIQKPGQHIDGLAWSPDALHLASASGDKTVRIWDMTREIPSEVAILEGHTQQVRSVSFSADGSLLASKADDNSVRIWRTDKWRTDKWEEITAARKTEANGDGLWVPSIAFHPKKPILATFGAVNDAVDIWDIKLKEEPGSATAEVASGIDANMRDAPSQPLSSHEALATELARVAVNDRSRLQVLELPDVLGVRELLTRLVTQTETTGESGRFDPNPLWLAWMVNVHGARLQQISQELMKPGTGPAGPQGGQA